MPVIASDHHGEQPRGCLAGYITGVGVTAEFHTLYPLTGQAGKTSANAPVCPLSAGRSGKPGSRITYFLSVTTIEHPQTISLPMGSMHLPPGIASATALRISCCFRARLRNAWLLT